MDFYTSHRYVPSFDTGELQSQSKDDTTQPSLKLIHFKSQQSATVNIFNAK